ncbi:MAG: integrase family protein [Xylophilus sp.]|nr:integrase family protein [Xylophilus sp.]
MAKIAFTAGRVSGFKCPPGKTQAFMWDATAPGLGLRATPAGKPAYVFQSKYQGKDLRITIGGTAAWSIPQAQTKARELQRLIDEGTDPRDLKRDALAAHAEKQAAAAAQALTVGELWPMYLANGKPKRKDAWKPRYRADLEAMAVPGGEKKKRGQGVTRPGPLYPLLALPLVAINEDTLKSWYDREAVAGKHQAARALMMFRGFLRWCAARPEYRDMTDRDAGKAAAIVESLPRNTRRTDALDTAQIAGWWAGAEQLNNRTASVYLRALLLTGARREEMAALTWANVDFQWRKLTLADKVENTRTIPLPPYLAQMLATLPRVSRYVFAGTGKTGRIADARASHAQVLQHAQVARLTFHGLRRTFIRQARSIAPAGVPAQIAGHAPSAVAEGYAILSIDELRPHAERVEAHVLSLAGVQFDAQAVPGALRVVAA